VLSPNEDYLAEFVYLVSTAGDNIDRLARLADGGTYPAISPEVIVETRCVRPTSEVFKAFHEIANSLMKLFDTNALANIALANVRDELLPKLLSGELEVP
jgi:type I restriction enzyme S subunit